MRKQQKFLVISSLPACIVAMLSLVMLHQQPGAATLVVTGIATSLAVVATFAAWRWVHRNWIDPLDTLLTKIPFIAASPESAEPDLQRGVASRLLAAFSQRLADDEKGYQEQVELLRAELEQLRHAHPTPQTGNPAPATFSPLIIPAVQNGFQNTIPVLQSLSAFVSSPDSTADVVALGGRIQRHLSTLHYLLDASGDDVTKTVTTFDLRQLVDESITMVHAVDSNRRILPFFEFHETIATGDANSIRCGLFGYLLKAEHEEDRLTIAALGNHRVVFSTGGASVEFAIDVSRLDAPNDTRSVRAIIVAESGLLEASLTKRLTQLGVTVNGTSYDCDVCIAAVPDEEIADLLDKLPESSQLLLLENQTSPNDARISQLATPVQHTEFVGELASVESRRANQARPRRAGRSREELPIFDADLSLALANGRPELAEELFEILMTSLNTDRDAINVAAEKNSTRFANLVHRLNGGIRYCGVPRLQESLRKLDAATRHGEDNEVRLALQVFNHEIDALITFYEPSRTYFETSILNRL